MMINFQNPEQPIKRTGRHREEIVISDPTDGCAFNN